MSNGNRGREKRTRGLGPRVLGGESVVLVSLEVDLPLDPEPHHVAKIVVWLT